MPEVIEFTTNRGVIVEVGEEDDNEPESRISTQMLYPRSVLIVMTQTMAPFLN